MIQVFIIKMPHTCHSDTSAQREQVVGSSMILTFCQPQRVTYQDKLEKARENMAIHERFIHLGH